MPSARPVEDEDEESESRGRRTTKIMSSETLKCSVWLVGTTGLGQVDLVTTHFKHLQTRCFRISSDQTGL